MATGFDGDPLPSMLVPTSAWIGVRETIITSESVKSYYRSMCIIASYNYVTELSKLVDLMTT